MIRVTLAGVVLLALASCHRFVPEQASPDPFLPVEKLLNGDLSGTRIVFNRNEQIVRSGTVSMHCEASGPQSSTCTEKVVFAGGLSEKRTDEIRFEYSYTYRDAAPAAVTRKAAASSQEGTASGSLLYLTGTGVVPLSADVAATETRIQAIYADQETYYQVDVIRQAGLEAGRTVTIWTRKK